jgi:hypothetical protein
MNGTNVKEAGCSASRSFFMPGGNPPASGYNLWISVDNLWINVEKNEKTFVTSVKKYPIMLKTLMRLYWSF